MKEIKSSKKTSAFKKIFIKICRFLGYELIDQSTLNFPLIEKQIDHLSIPGEKSITLGSGELKIDRKVNGIDIFLKTCTSVELVSQNKRRIFEKDKSEYTFKSIKSLKESIEILKKKFPQIYVNITVIDIGSKDSDREKISNFFEGFNFKFIKLDKNNLNFKPRVINKNNKEIENNMSSTMASIHESFVQAKSCKDLIYFVEDDYLHKPEALTEMVFAYEKFATVFKKDIFLLSTDYPYLYKKLSFSNILTGEKYHWRTVAESLLTFLTSRDLLLKYYDRLLDMAKNESNPFEKNLHDIYKNEICLSPVPTLSIHCTNVNSVFGLSPNTNIKKLWDDYEV